MKDPTRYTLLALVIGILGISIYFLSDSAIVIETKTEILPVSVATEKEGMYQHAREISAPSGFVNTNGKPVTIGEFIGKKVILVDFLTYSCINCTRVQPYLNAWHEKYSDQGLQIIGIHTPEFEFEKNITNVERAMRDMEVKYPVVLDNDYGTWHAYQNSYWPRKYLIDIDGYVVYDHIGEGGYDDTEHTIRRLLDERAARLGDKMSTVKELVSLTDVESVTDHMPRTPEIYFGSLRNTSYLANGTAGHTGPQNFSIPSLIQTNSLYLGGPWKIESEHAKGMAGSSIKIRYQAKKVFFVASGDGGARIKVFIDGKPIHSSVRGRQVGPDSTVSIEKDDLYRLIESDSWGEHTLDITVEEGELSAFTFSFG